MPESPSARAAALAAAREAMISGAWPTTAMAVIARDAGVSRQTLYNEFGSRTGLAESVAHETADRFLAGAQQAALSGPDPVGRIRAAMSWALAAAGEDLLIKAALTADDGGLLPFLTTRSRDLLVPIARSIAAVVGGPDADWACEVALRLTVSHMLMPVRSDSEHLDRVADLVRPLFATKETP